MVNTFKCTITTPSGNLFEGSISRATLSTEMGEITVLANHEPLVALAKSGEAEIEQGGRILKFELGGGVVEVEQDGSLFLLLRRASAKTDS